MVELWLGWGFDNINWWEVQKYVAVFYTPEEIEREGLRKVIPLRVKATKRPLTMNCLSNNAAKLDHENIPGFVHLRELELLELLSKPQPNHNSTIT